MFVSHIFRQSSLASLENSINDIKNFSWQSAASRRDLRFMPLDPEYCVPALVFCGWTEENIMDITKDGWFSYADDAIVEEEVRRYYSMWSEIFNSNDDESIRLVRDMRAMLETGKKDILSIFTQYSRLFTYVVDVN